MIHLHVIGLPAQQGSKTRMPNGAMVDGNSPKARANLGAWRQAVRAECRRWLEQHPAEPLAEPVELHLAFTFPQVASDPYRTAHVNTPDLDKLLRSTFDALVQGGMLVDDRKIWKVAAEKRYCWPGEPAGCAITIEPQGAIEAQVRESRKQQAAEARKATRAVPA